MYVYIDAGMKNLLTLAWFIQVVEPTNKNDIDQSGEPCKHKQSADQSEVFVLNIAKVVLNHSKLADYRETVTYPLDL